MRVRAAAGSASTRDTSAHGIEVLERTSENITAAFSDDYMKANADFRSRAGLDTYIERRTSGKCCPWCTEVAGRYLMSEQPEGLFRRHDNCDCVIIYDGKVLRGQRGENGRRTRTWEDTGERAARIEYAESKKPAKLSREEAEKLQAENLPKRLTGGENGGIIDVVENALGISKQDPMSIEEAVQGANPKYSTDRQFQVNCQRCVQTYELRRRGYDVEALPKPKGRSIIDWGNECFIDSKDVLSGKAYSYFEMRQHRTDIFDKLTNSEDGARYVIYSQWKRGGAHVFIAEKENGVVRFVDPQSGIMDCSSHFNMAVDGRYGIFRLDDKSITDNPYILQNTAKGVDKK